MLYIRKSDGGAQGSALYFKCEEGGGWKTLQVVLFKVLSLNMSSDIPGIYFLLCVLTFFLEHSIEAV